MVSIIGTWGRLAPSLVAMYREANRLAPGRSEASDGSIGNAQHAGTVSDHNPVDGIVHALDLTHDPDGGWDAFARLEQLRRNRDPRIKYAIWHRGRQMFSSYPTAGSPAWAWRLYLGGFANEAHVSILDSFIAENDLRPWFPPEEDDMNAEEAEAVFRRVLDEGTPVGATGWASANRDAIATIQQTFNGVAALLARAPGDVDVTALAAMLKEGLGEAVAAELAERLAS